MEWSEIQGNIGLNGQWNGMEMEWNGMEWNE